MPNSTMTSFSTVKFNSVFTFLFWISGTFQHSSSLFSSGLNVSPTISSMVRIHQQQREQQSSIGQSRLYHPLAYATGYGEKRELSISTLLRRLIAKKQSVPRYTTAIRGETNDDDDDDDDDLADYGDKVASIFGNLRIPASLVAGAALGSAFSMPLADTDGLKMGAVKRLFTLGMLGTMSSMLLTVLLATMCMNDIALSPPRPAKYVKDYIEKNYALEWMLMKTHFMWGNVVFVLGSMLRGWVFLKCPIIGDGVLGIMGSLMLISVSILVEFTKNQTGESPMQQIKRNISLVLDKTKTNRLFAVSAAMWLSTLVYVIAKIPYVYLQLTSP